MNGPTDDFRGYLAERANHLGTEAELLDLLIDIESAARFDGEEQADLPSDPVDAASLVSGVLSSAEAWISVTSYALGVF